MADAAKPEKLTLGEALKDLGWFPIVFAVAVGGPSILSIIESVLVDHQLVPALQWIVDGYDRIMAVLGAAVEPLVQPAIDWVNARFGWSLVLDPVWRPVFALGMVVVMAMARTVASAGAVGRGLFFGALLALTLVAVALGIGLIAREFGWIVQGAIAAMPAVVIGLSTALSDGWRGNWELAGSRATGVVVYGTALFLASAGLSQTSLFATTSGLFVLGVHITLSGFLGIAAGLRLGNRNWTRMGLTMIGGFIAAGLILAADWGLKALGAG